MPVQNSSILIVNCKTNQGIISNVRDDGDPNDITLIENLVTKYITGSCIILQAMSMKDDLENQRAGRMAKLADPEGVRTVGKKIFSFFHDLQY